MARRRRKRPLARAGQEDLLVRRAAAVGGVGEDVVDRERAADARRAASSPRSRARAGSTPWPPSMNTNASGVAQCRGDDRRLRRRRRRRRPRARRRGSWRGTIGSVSIRPVRGSTTRRVVVLPAGLVLLRAAVVVDGEHDRAGLARPRRRARSSSARSTSRPRRTAAPGTRRGGGERGGVQRIALVGRHEALGGERVRAAPVDHAIAPRYGVRTVPHVGEARRAWETVPMQAALDDLVDAARPRADRGQHLPRPLARREPPARVRRPGRRPGARRRGPHGRRPGPARPLAARLLPAPRRPDVPILYEVDRIRDGTSFTHPPRRRDPARPGDLQPPGQLPRPRAGPGPPDPDAAGAARPRDAAGLARRAWRRTGSRSASGTTAPRPIDLRYIDGDPFSRKGTPADGQRVWMRADGDAARRPDAARLHRHLRQRHDAARHDGAAVRAVVGQPGHADGQPRPRDVVPPPVPRRRVAALRPARVLDAARPAASPAARSSPATAGSPSPSCRRAWPGSAGR